MHILKSLSLLKILEVLNFYIIKKVLANVAIDYVCKIIIQNKIQDKIQNILFSVLCAQNLSTNFYNYDKVILYNEIKASSIIFIILQCLFLFCL